MYGGKGIVYMLQMFAEKELANNRIGAYMVLLNKGDESGFHTHGDRNEEEIYLVIHGSENIRNEMVWIKQLEKEFFIKEISLL